MLNLRVIKFANISETKALANNSELTVSNDDFDLIKIYTHIVDNTECLL